MRVYLYGRDMRGWSLDADRRHTMRFLTDLGHELAPHILAAPLVHAVWWNLPGSWRAWPFAWKYTLAVASSSITEREQQAPLASSLVKDFERVNRLVDLWVAPSRRQESFFEERGIPACYQPFYVDEEVFRPRAVDRAGLCRRLGIDPTRLEGRLVIGSIQRDSLGRDLRRPRWQKGPAELVEILSKLPLPRDCWLLFLAGPRRHFVIAECEKHGIPYYYHGREPRGFDEDDVAFNSLSEAQVALLYQLFDCYLVTSRSEGGPKAVIEAALSKTLVFSTPVGLAPDYLEAASLYEDIDGAIDRLLAVAEQHLSLGQLAERNYQRALELGSYDRTRARWQSIYETIEQQTRDNARKEGTG